MYLDHAIKIPMENVTTEEDLDALIARLNEERRLRWKDLSENLRQAELSCREAETYIAELASRPRETAKRLYYPEEIEPIIPHNWGIGLGEGFDYLDADTRHRIYQAIDLEEDRYPWSQLDD